MITGKGGQDDFCYSFGSKGVCIRGDSCPYIHARKETPRPRQPAGPPPGFVLGKAVAPQTSAVRPIAPLRPGVPAANATVPLRPGVPASNAIAPLRPKGGVIAGTPQSAVQLRPGVPVPGAARPASPLTAAILAAAQRPPGGVARPAMIVRPGSVVVAPRDGRQGVTPAPGFEAGTMAPPKADAPWKTELCMRMHATGTCALGAACKFAHGLHELRKGAMPERKPTPEPENPLDCKFGRMCKRPECWFQHPQGRIIDQDPNLSMCRFGNECGRPDCFYVHPKDLESEPFMVHIDELAMPKRPQVLPSRGDREVFMDPLPNEPGSKELDEFLKAFGEYEDVYQIPKQERGYVLFKQHREAANCVESFAGQWSESERCANRKRSRDKSQRGQSAYPENIILHIRGREGSNVKKLMDSTGVKQLRILDGFKANDTSPSGRLCFAGKGTPAQVTQLKTELEELLAGIHETFAGMIDARRSRELSLWGLPESWSEDEVSMLVGQHGDVESKHSRGRGRVNVVYADADDADKAMKELDGMDMSEFGAGKLHCEMVQERHYPERKNAALFFGNLPFEATEEDIQALCEEVGPVASIRLGMDKDRDRSKGFAFVDFAVPEDSERAIQALNDRDLHGRRLRVNRADEKSGRKRQRSEDRDRRRDRGDGWGGRDGRHDRDRRDSWGGRDDRQDGWRDRKSVV